jgi:alpha-glucosidase
MVHNVAALSMQQAIFEGMQRYGQGRRTFILSRSGFAGSQRYGVALWSGDVDMTFAALRKQIAVGLNTCLAGFPLWSSDIGGFGFDGKCSSELYIRWFQFGAFCPICRPHGDQTELREPWQFGDEVEAICRKYLRLRYRLLPYLYNALREACTRGTPLMRALVVDFPGDAEVVNLSDQYLFGPELLVAPVVEEGATQRKVYLPEGCWIDFWTDVAYSGRQWVNVMAPLEILPLFVRQGAILPLGPDVQHSSEKLWDRLMLEVYRGENRICTLYEDDGETLDYQEGRFTETLIETHEHDERFACSIGQTRGDFSPAKADRTIEIKIHCGPEPQKVDCDGVAVELVRDPSNDKAELGYWWDQSNEVLTIKLLRKLRALTVEVK